MFTAFRKHTWVKIIALAVVLIFTFQQTGLAEVVDTRKEGSIGVGDVLLAVIAGFIQGACIVPGTSFFQLFISTYLVPLAARELCDALGIKNPILKALIEMAMSMGADAGFSIANAGEAVAKEATEQASKSLMSIIMEKVSGFLGLDTVFESIGNFFSGVKESMFGKAAEEAGKEAVQKAAEGTAKIADGAAKVTEGVADDLQQLVTAQVNKMLPETGKKLTDVARAALIQDVISQLPANATPEMIKATIKTTLQKWASMSVKELAAHIQKVLASTGNTGYAAIAKQLGNAIAKRAQALSKGMLAAVFMSTTDKIIAVAIASIKGAALGAAREALLQALKNQNPALAKFVSSVGGLLVFQSLTYLQGLATGQVNDVLSKGGPVTYKLDGEALASRLSEDMVKFFKEFLFYTVTSGIQAGAEMAGLKDAGIIASSFMSPLLKSALFSANADVDELKKDRDSVATKEELLKNLKETSGDVNAALDKTSGIKTEEERAALAQWLNEFKVVEGSGPVTNPETGKTEFRGKVDINEGQRDKLINVLDMMVKQKDHVIEKIESGLKGALIEGIKAGIVSVALSKISRAMPTDLHGAYFNLFFSSVGKASLNIIYDAATGEKTLYTMPDNIDWLKTEDPAMVHMTQEGRGASYYASYILSTLGASASAAVMDTFTLGRVVGEIQPATGGFPTLGGTWVSGSDAFFANRLFDVVREVDAHGVQSAMMSQLINSMHGQSVKNVVDIVNDSAYRLGLANTSPFHQLYVYTPLACSEMGNRYKSMLDTAKTSNYAKYMEDKTKWDMLKGAPSNTDAATMYDYVKEGIAQDGDNATPADKALLEAIGSYKNFQDFAYQYPHEMQRWMILDNSYSKSELQKNFAHLQDDSTVAQKVNQGVGQFSKNTQADATAMKEATSAWTKAYTETAPVRLDVVHYMVGTQQAYFATWDPKFEEATVAQVKSQVEANAAKRGLYGKFLQLPPGQFQRWLAGEISTDELLGNRPSKNLLDLGGNKSTFSFGGDSSPLNLGGSYLGLGNTSSPFGIGTGISPGLNLSLNSPSQTPQEVTVVLAEGVEPTNVSTKDGAKLLPGVVVTPTQTTDGKTMLVISPAPEGQGQDIFLKNGVLSDNQRQTKTTLSNIQTVSEDSIEPLDISGQAQQQGFKETRESTLTEMAAGQRQEIQSFTPQRVVLSPELAEQVKKQGDSQKIVLTNVKSWSVDGGRGLVIEPAEENEGQTVEIARSVGTKLESLTDKSPFLNSPNKPIEVTVRPQENFTMDVGGERSQGQPVVRGISSWEQGQQQAWGNNLKGSFLISPEVTLKQSPDGTISVYNANVSKIKDNVYLIETGTDFSDKPFTIKPERITKLNDGTSYVANGIQVNESKSEADVPKISDPLNNKPATSNTTKSWPQKNAEGYVKSLFEQGNSTVVIGEGQHRDPAQRQWVVEEIKRLGGEKTYFLIEIPQNLQGLVDDFSSGRLTQEGLANTKIEYLNGETKTFKEVFGDTMFSLLQTAKDKNMPVMCIDMSVQGMRSLVKNNEEFAHANTGAFQERDAYMAEQATNIMKNNPDARFIVLVGALHSSTKTVSTDTPYSLRAIGDPNSEFSNDTYTPFGQLISGPYSPAYGKVSTVWLESPERPDSLYQQFNSIPTPTVIIPTPGSTFPLITKIDPKYAELIARDPTILGKESLKPELNNIFTKGNFTIPASGTNSIVLFPDGESRYRSFITEYNRNFNELKRSALNK